MQERSNEFAEMMAQFAKQVNDMPYKASSIMIFAEMPNNDQIESYIAGVMVGMMTALRDQMKAPESMDEVERYIIKCVPMARQIAENWSKRSTGS